MLRLTSSRRRLLCLAAAVVGLTYANHFQNNFHFDDIHTIVDNPAIREISNVPRFFADARTFSTEAYGWLYRPVVSASIAADYWLAKGLHPFAFHASTFIWFLVGLGVMFLLFHDCLERCRPAPANFGIAFLATLLYGLHPALAETVNYIIQRADLYVVVASVGGLVVYSRWPGTRRYGLYLAPVLVGILSKAPALIFPALLLIWLRIVDQAAWSQALRRCLPALLFTAAAGYWTVRMTPPSFDPHSVPALRYLISQPAVLFHYFREFLAPLHLSADTDRVAFLSLFQPEAMAGFAFLILLFATILWCLRQPQTRPVAFGLLWFFIASLPTSLYPLAEVENDHRMSFPFVGLTLAASCTLALLAERFALTSRVRFAVCVPILIALAWGTWQRNEVWRTETSLWRDATLKSPGNPRGWLNYGAALMSKGDFAAGLTAFENGVALGPTGSQLDSLLQMNLGAAFGELGNEREARSHFQRAMSLWPGAEMPRQRYAAWLHKAGFEDEAIAELTMIIQGNPDSVASRGFLAEIYLDRSAALANAGDFGGCVAAAERSVRLDKHSVGAFTNEALCEARLGAWDQAVPLAKSALRLNPNHQAARRVLLEAEEALKRQTPR